MLIHMIKINLRIKNKSAGLVDRIKINLRIKNKSTRLKANP
jgi:hypothetical protein